MRGVCRLSVIAFIFCFILGGGLAMANEEVEKKAAEVSSVWLELIDEGKYDESWQTAATYFKDAVSPEQWRRSLTAVRNPLGKVISRKLKSTQYLTSLPGAPDGEYVVIQFETSFQNKISAIETVTPMLDKDGRWRVSGYYIK